MSTPGPYWGDITSVCAGHRPDYSAVGWLMCSSPVTTLNFNVFVRI